MLLHLRVEHKNRLQKEITMGWRDSVLGRAPLQQTAWGETDCAEQDAAFLIQGVLGKDNSFLQLC